MVSHRHLPPSIRARLSGRHARRVICLAAAALVVACSSASTKVLPPVVNVSIGQQLIDLKKARDAGAITQREYEQQSKRVIESVE